MQRAARAHGRYWLPLAAVVRHYARGVREIQYYTRADTAITLEYDTVTLQCVSSHIVFACARPRRSGYQH